MKVTGILLAGGKSSRMGTDKALLNFGPITFIEQLTSLLKQICSEVIIVGEDRNIENLNTTYVPDLEPEKGPLMGLMSGLSASKTEINLVLSIDSPLLNLTDLEMIINKHHSRYDVTLFKAEKIHPFPGVYDKKLISNAASAIENNELRLTEFIRNNKPQIIPAHKDTCQRLENINTPKDYKRIFENEIRD